MSETNPNVAPTLTREQKIVAKVETLKARIAADTLKVNELVEEYNSIAALAAIDVGSAVVVKLGRKFADKDTTRFENAVVIGVKEEEDGSKLYKVSYGVGFEADIAIVGGAALSLPVAEAAAE
jgi:hypothetical protein